MKPKNEQARLLPTLQAPETISSEQVYASPFLRIRRVEKRMPGGSDATFHIRDEADVAVCLPVTRDGRFVLVEEYRHGPERVLFEVPGGNVDDGEDAAAAAAREVLEETGYAGEMRHLGSCWISAYSGARKHIFLMTDARAVQPPAPAEADLARVVLATRAELQSVLDAGDLTDLDAALLCLRALDAPAPG